VNSIKLSKTYYSTEKVLISFYFKKFFKSFRVKLCFIFILIPLAYSFIDIQNYINSSVEINQLILDNSIFLRGFLSFSLIYYNITTIIISCDIISEEFSNRTAMVLYSTTSRKKILISKIIFIILLLMFFELTSFISFGILSTFTLGLMISPIIFILGFFLILINMLFIFSLTFFFSALTRNTVVALLIPFFYNYSEQLFILSDLKFLSYSQQLNNLISFIQNIITNGNSSIKYYELTVSFIIFFTLPIIFIVITFYTFKKLDIRI